MNKTNAMRLLDAAGIAYRAVEYEYDESDLGGQHVAQQTGMDPDQVFKTLVARGERNGILVFCIPVSCTLDLKKAAAVAGDKKVEMTHMKELLGLTGYVGAQEIKIEKSTEKIVYQGKSYYLHTVKAKETLFSICKAYGVSVDEVKILNAVSYTHLTLPTICSV